MTLIRHMRQQNVQKVVIKTNWQRNGRLHFLIVICNINKKCAFYENVSSYVKKGRLRNNKLN